MKIKIIGMREFNVFSTKISNVSYINNFSTNLLSIKKITQELNCDIIFSQNDIKFQNRETRKIISKGKIKNRLYVLKSQHRLCVLAKKNQDHQLLYKRLWHPLDKVLSIFKIFLLEILLVMIFVSLFQAN
jgi:hypothetical protein